MTAVHVCPMSRLVDTLAATEARSVVTLLAGDAQHLLPQMPGVDHLLLDMADISAPREGYPLPSRVHVIRLLDFARAWKRNHALLIHCHAGVGRSTAAAFAITCALEPSGAERDVAARLRAASPSATPNPLIVALADDLLDRQGRMVAAIAEIGRGRDCFEGEVFRLAISNRPAAASDKVEAGLR